MLIFIQWLVTRRKRTSTADVGKKDVIEKGNGQVMVEALSQGGMQGADWVALIGLLRTFTW